MSIVTGEISEHEDAVTLLRACSRAAITGAPKVRAMEIITEIERLARGLYCGAIAFVGFDGHMDTNIAILLIMSPGVV
ncbi:chorismate-binding protein [Bradyrhizobium sp. CCBAU 11386]|uniref:chorismate-binding protein n=1 Tax=Bradyrhizobium sp. CCBAU 11386 TaxID=1630837 RepID=UPI002304CE5A|nr:chorismate-binding protein [Bradyrhizobium sp. CCBAU 11386]